ncbi:MAG: transposase, partial [Planctomycetaceae bacterium]|nr:transposase [Planctomycetaceae bacterium]
YRRQWIRNRFEFLAGIMGIEVLGFAVMSNHFHIILRNRPDVVDSWSNEEVARRWRQLCPARRDENGFVVPATKPGSTCQFAVA